jgi:protein TonB
MNRYLSSFLLTLGLYLGLFVVVLFSWDKKVEFTDKTKEAKSVQVTLVALPKPAKPTPPTPPVEETQPKEEPQEKPIEEPKKIEKIEPKVEEELKAPLPTPKKVVKKEPIKKKPVKKIVKKKTKKPTKKLAKKQRKSNPKRAKKSIITKKSKSSSKKLAQKRNLYYATLKRKINRNKSYPRVAKRRGMQGSVKVKFTLSSGGSLKNIIIVSGPKVFHNATRSAIKRSLPYAPPKGVFKKSISLTINVDYKLI